VAGGQLHQENVDIEIKDYEIDEEKAKHAAAKRWFSAVNKRGKLGQWCFHLSWEPQMIDKGLEHI